MSTVVSPESRDAATTWKAIVIITIVVMVGTGLCFAARSLNSEGTMETKQELPAFKFDLGSKVRCKITGFEGVVTGQHRYLYGCLTYTVKPTELKDGKPIDSVGFDEGQLELVPTPALEHKPITTGGPCPVIPPVSR